MAAWYDRMVLMFQKEVAERIVATPGTKAYGRLSVLAQWRTRAKILMTLKPEAFTPPPRWPPRWSSSSRARARAACSVRTLGRVTAAAFGQRRKMLRTSLASLVAEPAALLAAAGIAPELRAERLDVARLRGSPTSSNAGPGRARNLQRLLQLAHERHEPREALAPQPLGGEDRAQALEAAVEIGVDDDVVVFRPVADLVARLRHAPRDRIEWVLVARFRPLRQHLARGRRHEDAHDVARHLLRELLPRACQSMSNSTSRPAAIACSTGARGVP